MAAFAEIRIDEGLIVYGAIGSSGGYKTDIVEVNSGFENRNSVWQNPKGKWDLGQRKMSQNDLQTILAFFHARKGRFEGFRFKDFADFTATAITATLPQVSTRGVMSAITPAGTIPGLAGSGYPTYQLAKTYSSGTSMTYRLARKPVAGTVAPFRNGVAVISGSGAGQYSVDTTTGIITFVADAISSATVVTPGTTTQVTLSGNPGTLIAGQLIYLSGFAGADSALLNGVAHTINSVTGVGPYVFTLATNTIGKAITLGAGAGAKYPQATETLTADFQFDVPVRFDIDQLNEEFLAAAITTPGTTDQVFYHLPHTPIVEIRV